MRENQRSSVNSLCNSVIMVADKFIHKCETGRAKSVETLSDMLKIRQEAEMLKASIIKEVK